MDYFYNKLLLEKKYVRLFKTHTLLQTKINIKEYDEILEVQFPEEKLAKTLNTFKNRLESKINIMTLI